MEPLSGRQFGLSAGDYSATIASVGASLRELTWHGRHLVVPFDADEVRPDYRGAVLAPRPNRVVDGRYQFSGVDHQLALTEPERGHALHGLAVWQDFAVVSQQLARTRSSNCRLCKPVHRRGGAESGFGR